jgi:hypothetical protein
VIDAPPAPCHPHHGPTRALPPTTRTADPARALLSGDGVEITVDPALLTKESITKYVINSGKFSGHSLELGTAPVAAAKRMAYADSHNDSDSGSGGGSGQ